MLARISVGVHQINRKSYIIKKIMSTLQEFNKLIQPLEYLQISSFSYIRIFNNQKYLALSNQYKWLEYHLLHAESAGAFFTNKARQFESLKLQHAIWPTRPTDEVLTSLYNHNIWHGISLFRTSSGFTERFCFASTRDDNNITSFYLNNIDLLIRFVIYFRCEGDALIKGYDPLCFGQYKKIDEDQDHLQSGDIGIKFADSLNNTTQIKLPDGRFVTLPPQESKCLKYLANCQTAEEIAKNMGISANTVGYYIHNMKAKLGCTTRADLINLYKESKLSK